MKKRKKKRKKSNRLGQRLPQLLVLIAVLCATATFAAQAWRLWHTVEGQLAAMPLISTFYLVLFLGLATQNKSPGGRFRGAAKIYLLSLLFQLAQLAITVRHPAYHWSPSETYTLALAGGATAIVFGWAALSGRGVKHPVPSAIMAMVLTAAPQLMFARSIGLHGGGGLAGWAVIFSNVALGARLLKIWSEGQLEGWPVTRRWHMASELVNAATWWTACATWGWWRFYS